FQLGNVFHRVTKVDILLISQWESATITIGEGDSGGLSLVLYQCVAQAVAPRQGRLCNPLLDRSEVDFESRVSGSSDDHVHSGMIRPGNLHLGLDALAAEAVQHDPLDPLPNLGVVAIARNIDQAGVETMIRVATHQQTDRAALVQIHDAPPDTDQI